MGNNLGKGLNLERDLKNCIDQKVVQIYLRQLFGLYNLRDAISKPLS